MASRANLIATYNSNPTLQGQYTQQQYLDLFDFGQTPGTGTPPPVQITPTDPNAPKKGITNIIGQNLNQGGGGSGIIPARGSQQRINDFNNAIAARQERLNNPNKIQSFVNSAKQMIGIEPQMSVDQMLARSGYMNPQQRPTGGIPFGVGSAIGMMVPDKYYDMPLEDQIFTQSQMGYNDGSGYKDEFGYNTRSAFGNYGEFVEERVDKTGKALETSAKNFSDKNPDLGTVSFDKITGKAIGDQDAIDAWNKQTSYIQKEFFSFTNKAKERKNISDRVAKEKRDQDARLAKEEAANRARRKAAASRAESARQYDPNIHGPNNYGLGSDGKQSYDSGQGFGTNATTGGPVSNKSGKGRTDYNDGGRVYLYNRLK